MDATGKIEDNILEQVYALNQGYIQEGKVSKSGRKQAIENAGILGVSEREHGEMIIFLKQNIKGK
jgi:hypothetical protein